MQNLTTDVYMDSVAISWSDVFIMVDHFKERIDLKDELKFILEELQPHFVALRSAQLDQKCPECAKRSGEQYVAVSATCMACLNTGHLFIDKLLSVYSYKASSGYERLAEIGVITADAMIYIVQGGHHPKEGDKICELDLDEDTGEPKQPFRIRRIFNIQNAKELRGEDGRIEYFKLYCEEYNLDRGQNIW